MTNIYLVNKVSVGVNISSFTWIVCIREVLDGDWPDYKP
jgi:hypothetical protein